MREPTQAARDLAAQLHSPRADLIQAALDKARQEGRDEALAPFRAARARALVRARRDRPQP